MEIKPRAEKNYKIYLKSDKNRNKSVKRENKAIYFFIKLLIITNSLFPIVSDSIIEMNVDFNNNYNIPIINTKNIGHPTKIYIENDKIQYEYKNDDYLYMKKICTNNYEKNLYK